MERSGLWPGEKALINVYKIQQGKKPCLLYYILTPQNHQMLLLTENNSTNAKMHASEHYNEKYSLVIIKHRRAATRYTPAYSDHNSFNPH